MHRDKQRAGDGIVLIRGLTATQQSPPLVSLFAVFNIQGYLCWMLFDVPLDSIFVLGRPLLRTAKHPHLDDAATQRGDPRDLDLQLSSFGSSHAS